MHLVVILDWEKIGMTREEYIDEYITAEIPAKPENYDRSKEAQLQRKYREIVCKQMYHTCSQRFCLRDGKCTKRFPVNQIF